jgi:TrmH RNA methyltransferase
MPSPAAYRTAEGGLETVPAVPLPEPLRALRALHAAGFTLVATSSHAAAPFQATAGGLPPRCVLLLGAEGEGLSPALAAAADRNVAIPGTGAVESINVACAAAVLLAEFWRRHRLAAGTGA